MMWVFRSNIKDGDSLCAADGIGRVMVWGGIIIFILLFISGCVTADRQANYVVDCNDNIHFPSDGEKSACERGKTETNRELQAAREYSAYQQGRGGYTSSSQPANYWPILGVGIRTWSGYGYGYYPYDNGRRRPRENYNCDGFLRYTPHCN